MAVTDTTQDPNAAVPKKPVASNPAAQTSQTLNPVDQNTSVPAPFSGAAPDPTSQGGVMPATPGGTDSAQTPPPMSTGPIYSYTGPMSNLVDRNTSVPPPQTPQIPGGISDADQAAQQKLYRDALIKQMGEGTNVDVNDPNIKAQLDPFVAQQERARQEEIRQGAEQAFATGQSYGSPEKNAAIERAGNASGLQAADLVGKEITAKRQEIADALTKFGNVMSEDQKNALEKRAQDLDAQAKAQATEADIYKTNKQYDISKYQTDKGFDMDKMRLDADTIIRKAGLDQTGQLGNRELDIRDKLGMAGMNAQMVQLLLQDQQFRARLGLDAGIAESDANRQAAIALMNNQ